MNAEQEQEIKKKILTATVGALARFEKYFGYLWGHNKENITAEEEKMLDLWEETRYEILNFGNQQIRSLDHIISSPKIRHKYTFRPNPGDRYEI